MKEPDNKSFWDRHAKIYAPFMKSSAGMYQDICNCIRPHLNRDMNVLELACGTGQLSIPLSGWVRLWEATDFSESMITEAKKQDASTRLHFSVQDATKLPYAADTFDAVVISNALHIMPNPSLALAQIRNVMKPDGMLFAPTFIHGGGIGFRLRVRLMELVGFHTFYKWSEKEFVEFLENNGFVAVEHHIMGGSLTPCCFVMARLAKGGG